MSDKKFGDMLRAERDPLAEIERLRAENEKLAAENAFFLQDSVEVRAKLMEATGKALWPTEADRLRAENKGLREACEVILKDRSRMLSVRQRGPYKDDAFAKQCAREVEMLSAALTPSSPPESRRKEAEDWLQAGDPVSGVVAWDRTAPSPAPEPTSQVCSQGSPINPKTGTCHDTHVLPIDYDREKLLETKALMREGRAVGDEIAKRVKSMQGEHVHNFESDSKGDIECINGKCIITEPIQEPTPKLCKNCGGPLRPGVKWHSLYEGKCFIPLEPAFAPKPTPDVQLRGGTLIHNTPLNTKVGVIRPPVDDPQNYEPELTEEGVSQLVTAITRPGRRIPKLAACLARGAPTPRRKFMDVVRDLGRKLSRKVKK